MVRGSPENPTATLPRLATAEEIAEELGVPRGTLYSLVRNRQIPHSRIGTRMVRFDRAAVRAWLASGGSFSSKGRSE